ncbi:MAG: type III-B CRISPR module RAMP protein Cmr4 [Candidatus Omnitrophica bacterium]|nr:type III-B CRISPR module RAMP protein Cmr4 [Candidatus Omnitrophota bacterium]
MSNENEIRNPKCEMQRKLLYLFTRTPLHVGAGASVGAIDQPIIRERHTGFPVIPASSLKGTFADAWNGGLMEDGGKRVRVRVREDGEKTILDATEAGWLFGSDNANHSFAGAIQFTEARLLVFPIRSAKGSFAWITCPLILARAARDGVLDQSLVPSFPAHADGQPDTRDELAFFTANGPLAFGDKVVLEEYTFSRIGDEAAARVGEQLARLLPNEPVWREVASRLVILSDGMVSFFAQNACEVAQHVRINDETGTAAGGALFNQENVPSETMFYVAVTLFNGRCASFRDKTPDKAWSAFTNKLRASEHAFQFGGDASTGLGYCSVIPTEEKGA